MRDYLKVFDDFGFLGYKEAAFEGKQDLIWGDLDDRVKWYISSICLELGVIGDSPLDKAGRGGECGPYFIELILFFSSERRVSVGVHG